MTNPNDPKNTGKDAHRIQRPDAGNSNGGRVSREEHLKPREGHQEHVAPRDGQRQTDPVRETRREQPVREQPVREQQPRREAEPVKEEGSNPLKWLLPLLALLVLAGLLWWLLSGNDDDQDAAPATSEVATASEEASDEAEETSDQPTNAQEDEAANAEADAFIKEQLGIAEWDGTEDPAWAGHVDKIRTDGNNLIADLDVEKDSVESQDLGQNAATDIADLIRDNKDDERVGKTNQVQVNDVAGDLLQQETV